MVKKLLWLASLLAAIALALSLLSPQIDPTYLPWLPIFGLVFPLLALGNVLLVIVWLLAKDKRVILPLLMLLLSLIYLDRFVGISDEQPIVDSDAFTIATYNMSNAVSGYDREADKRHSKRQKLEKYLHLLRPADILCVQEKGAFATDVIKSVFNEHELYSHAQKGAAILTRFPIIDRGFIDFGTITNSCLWADLVIGPDTVRVYSVHLQSNMITNDTKNVIANGDLQEEKTWQGIRRILGKFSTNHQKRIQQSHMIAEHIGSSAHPVVLCGDLNDTPMSYTYSLLTRGLADSFIERGRGLASTYADNIPLLRIDYILSSPSIEVLSHSVKQSPYSDHYPLVVELRSRH